MKSRIGKHTLTLLLLMIIASTASAHKSGPIVYQHYSRAFQNDVCEVLKCDKDVTGRIEVPYNVSRGTGNWVVESIALGAFQECGMQEVKLSGAIRTIGGQAFYNCPNLRIVELSQGTKFIESGAFSYCTALQQINLPESLKMLGDNAFYNCTSLTEITLGSNLDKLGQQAFFHCTALQKVDIRAPLSEIPTAAFSECYSLREITVGGSIRTIGQDAFRSSGIEKIFLGSRVNRIGFGAFAQCDRLTDIYLYTATPPAAQGAFFYNQYATIKIHVPRASKAAYASHPDWKDFKNIIADL